MTTYSEHFHHFMKKYVDRVKDTEDYEKYLESLDSLDEYVSDQPGLSASHTQEPLGSPDNL